MRVEFIRARLPADLRRLMAFDRKVFAKADLFTAQDWRGLECWWMLVDGKRAGCCGFEADMRKCLHIATTGIHPDCRGRGLGALMKAWQIAYAKSLGLSWLEAVTRKSNKAMLRLNRAFGFRIIRSIPHYYSDPDEPGILMRLRCAR